MIPSLDAKTLREHPWLAPEQMALAEQVMENELRRKGERYADGQLRRAPNKPRSHCGRGHAMTGENLRVYRYKKGAKMETTRVCVACLQIRHERNKAQLKIVEEQALKLLRKYGLPEKLRRGAAA